MNSFKVNEVNYKAGGLNKVKGLAMGARQTGNFKKIFCCLYIYFNYFNYFNVFRGGNSLLFQCFTGGNADIINLNADIINLNTDIINLNADIINLAMPNFLIYNRCKTTSNCKMNNLVAIESNVKKGCWKPPLKNFNNNMENITYVY